MGIGIDTSSANFCVLDAALQGYAGEDNWYSACTVGALHTIRSLAALGHLATAGDQEIAIECAWINDAGYFVQMLIGSGWVISCDGTFTLGPAWDAGIHSAIKE